jgi:hypothetical protein
MCENTAVPCNSCYILEILPYEWGLHKSQDIKRLKTGSSEANEL